ncbi:cytochrome P450 monooxygenase, putative [Trichophyton benhamiae CBS 112371]|uniref:Cytochrome P450 monooxygenase, putative n=1 Tax=Arthroderma benhamiae (strain ATCC MYA-4681 / CBS 112371) TaxID=663331 RepID=D4AWI3_ARTBC|nr:cytochrome P450 monooxygenase, putative [Trichophyton benhamiae CBS 112371]EFE32723.1 cytochrome P450 monooxygenase, putative [Trichophyton benhamiae CBS 112371]
METTNVSSGLLGPVYTALPEIEWNGRQGFALVIVAILSLHLFNVFKESLFGVKAPMVGYRSFFEPKWLLRLRFVRGSMSIIRGGYSKYKDSMFKISRNDADILVISNKYVDELRNLPEEELSGIEAHIRNLLGSISTTHVMLETNLHTRVLQTKLTPALGLIFDDMKDELNFALETELPECKDKWVPISINHLMLRLLARVSARIFVGRANCRNEEWLSASIDYTENIFITVMTLRMMPRYLHPFVAPLLPWYWRIRSNLATAKRFIGPIIRERREAEARQGKDYQKHEDLLQWMMDGANEKESNPDMIAHIELLLTLASIHTSSMATSNVMYDLCAHPEYFEPLREEMLSARREDGGWRKTTLTKLRKLDSFLKESQRMNPPSQLAFNRVVRSTLKLSDGTVLPAGTHFNIASDAIMNDPAKLPGGGDPEVFDGFRYERLRSDPAHPENANRFQLAMTDSNNLHFGHGKYACPGRFFASNEIKMIITELLLRYDFKYPEGQERPRSLSADENLYPDPDARVLIRKREEIWLIDIKPSNVLVNYGKDTRFKEVQLADFGSTVQESSTYARRGDPIGTPMLKSPEAHLQMKWGNSTDIWSFGAEGFHIFRPNVPVDHDDYDVKILMKHHRCFGPFPASYEEIADQERLAFLAWIMQNSPREMLRPFHLTTTREICPEDKEFVLRTMKLDLRDRPTARQLLEDKWFCQ